MPALKSLAAIAVEPPDLPVEEVAAAVREQFDIRGDLQPLVSERDQNFSVTTRTGERFVAKVVSRADDRQRVDCQVAALQHLEKKRLAGVPRVVVTTTGSPTGKIVCADNDSFVLRLVTWVDGELRREAALTPYAAANLGRAIARLDQAFEGFGHAGEKQDLLWDTRRAADLFALTHHIDGARLRKQVESALDDFVVHASESLASLPQQAIHNDVNGGNVLYADDDVCGIIDFGDMLRASRAQEISVAAAYLRDVKNPLRLIAPLLHTYDTISPFTKTEWSLMFDLIRARLCATTTILFWRLSERGADDPYRQKTLELEMSAADFLVALNRMGREQFNRDLQHHEFRNNL